MLIKGQYTMVNVRIFVRARDPINTFNTQVRLQKMKANIS